MLISLVLLLGLITPLVEDETIAETENNGTLDKVDKKIDKIYDTQQIMYKEFNNSLLEDKKYGIEFNIFRLLQISDYMSLSGDFSMFGENTNFQHGNKDLYINMGNQILTIEFLKFGRAF